MSPGSRAGERPKLGARRPNMYTSFPARETFRRPPVTMHQDPSRSQRKGPPQPPVPQAYNMHDRWYSPETGGFISAAPYPVWLEYPHAFVDARPTHSVDPTGRFGIPGLNPHEEVVFFNSPLAASDALGCGLRARLNSEAIARRRSLNGLEEDALRHCIWSCCMAEHAGSKNAKAWGDADEASSKKTTRSNDMDLRNNAIGRGLSENNLVCKGSGSGIGPCVDACEKAFDRGALQTTLKKTPRAKAR